MRESWNSMQFISNDEKSMTHEKQSYSTQIVVNAMQTVDTRCSKCWINRETKEE